MHNVANQKRKGAKSSHRVPATTIASTRWGVAIQITQAKEECDLIEMFQAWAGRQLKGYADCRAAAHGDSVRIQAQGQHDLRGTATHAHCNYV